MGNISLEYIMAPSSASRPVTAVSGAIKGKKGKETAKSPRTGKGLFGLLKGWTIDSQALSDELKE